MLFVSLSGCALDWDRFDPRLADGATSNDATPDVVITDIGPCGAPGLRCCTGNSCETGARCVSNVCMACPMGQIVCSGACVDPQVSDDHCGRCGVECRRTRNCVMGNCQ
jgi:hypothetical protein